MEFSNWVVIGSVGRKVNVCWVSKDLLKKDVIKLEGVLKRVIDMIAE